jgi:hypothetical protein
LVFRFIEHFQIVTTSNYNRCMNVHTLQITTVHDKSQAVMSLLFVAWLPFSLLVARLQLLTMEVLHGQPRIYCT